MITNQSDEIVVITFTKAPGYSKMISNISKVGDQNTLTIIAVDVDTDKFVKGSSSTSNMDLGGDYLHADYSLYLLSSPQITPSPADTENLLSFSYEQDSRSQNI
jgi:hypothetical protein